MDRQALTKLTHGLYVVGAEDTEQNRYCGLVVDAVMQVATDPPVIALSLMNTGYSVNQIKKTGMFSLSVLGVNIDPFVIANFGFQSSRTVDKWGALPFETKENLPYLPDALAVLEAHVIAQHSFASHTLFLAQIKEAWMQSEGEPLTYGDYQTSFKTQVMKSFNEKMKGIKMEKNEKWVCIVCGYVYDGDVPFEQLPDDWTCPLCGVGKDQFEKREV